MKIICLSSGIDSVGLLFHCLSKGEEVVALNICVSLRNNNTGALRPWMINHSIQRALCEELCDKISIKLMKIDLYLEDIQLSSQTPVHQRFIFGSICNIIALYNPEIEAFYFGATLNDQINDTHIEDFIVDVSKICNSGVRIELPIRNFNKQEAFNLIPKEYLNLLSTCWYSTNKSSNRCLKCLKCLQYAKDLTKESIELIDSR